MWNVDPSPCVVSTRIFPPCWVTICCATANPRPVPFRLVVNIGSKIRSMSDGAIPFAAVLDEERHEPRPVRQTLRDERNVVRARDTERHDVPRRGCVACVEDEIGDDLLQLHAVRAHEERRLRGNGQGPIPKEVLRFITEFVHPVAEVDRVHRRFGRLRVTQKLRSQACGPFRGLENLLRRAQRPRFRRGIAPDQFRERLNAHHDVIELVRHGCGHASERGHTPPLLDLFFQILSSSCTKRNTFCPSNSSTSHPGMRVTAGLA